MERIHNRLKRFRKEKGLAQKDVARILGVKSSSMISRWERGASLPETLNVLKLAAL
jgi:transcriptional regulator with XRE-family HTH domain